MTTLKSVTISVVLLVGGTSLAMAQNGLPTGGQSPVAGGANGGWYPGYGYSYGYTAAPLYNYAAPTYRYAAPTYAAPAPLYNYAAPAYAAPARAGTTVVIVMPAPAYAAPPVTTGYYSAPVVSQPIYNYAPAYGYDYTPGYWNRGYWGGWGYGWR